MTTTRLFRFGFKDANLDQLFAGTRAAWTTRTNRRLSAFIRGSILSFLSQPPLPEPDKEKFSRGWTQMTADVSQPLAVRVSASLTRGHRAPGESNVGC